MLRRPGRWTPPHPARATAAPRTGLAEGTWRRWLLSAPFRSAVAPALLPPSQARQPVPAPSCGTVGSLATVQPWAQGSASPSAHTAANRTSCAKAASSSSSNRSSMSMRSASRCALARTGQRGPGTSTSRPPRVLVDARWHLAPSTTLATAFRALVLLVAVPVEHNAYAQAQGAPSTRCPRTVSCLSCQRLEDGSPGGAGCSSAGQGLTQPRAVKGEGITHVSDWDGEQRGFPSFKANQSHQSDAEAHPRWPSRRG